jgi:hypothetical protein
MCPIPNGFRDRAISLRRFKIVDKKETLRTAIPVFIVQVTKLVQSTLYNTFAKVQQQQWHYQSQKP